MAKPKKQKRSKAAKQEAEIRAATHAVLRRLHVGRFAATVKKTHEDGSSAGESTAYGDAVTEIHVNGDAVTGGKRALAAELRQLAHLVLSSEDDYNGGGHVIVLRRYSHAFLKRLRGE